MDDIKISLCIPTMDRFDTFLKNNLTKYLQSNYIDEIVISDENGSDVKKIQEYFSDEVKNEKIKLSSNENILGPFNNKLKVCILAKNKWLALIDSDNYCNEEYFKKILDYISNNKLNQYSILSPSFAKPNFDYRSLENAIITKHNIKEIKQNDKKNILNIIMNTGNYVLNKTIINNLNIKEEIKNISKSSACDVIFINTLFFEQYPEFQFHIIKDLSYEHVVHPGSTYLTTHQNYYDFNKNIYKRFDNL